MTRTRKAAAAIVRAFEEARDGYTWRGGGPPGDAPYWEERYANARERLIQYLMNTGGADARP